MQEVVFVDFRTNNHLIQYANGTILYMEAMCNILGTYCRKRL